MRLRIYDMAGKIKVQLTEKKQWESIKDYKLKQRRRRRAELSHFTFLFYRGWQINE